MKFTKSSKHSDKFYCTARGRKSKLPLYDTSLLVFFFFNFTITGFVFSVLAVTILISVVANIWNILIFFFF